MAHTEKKLDSQTKYTGKVISLAVDTVELENGIQAQREVIHHNGGVTVLAIDEAENVLFVRQFRYPYGEVLLELPAGKLEKGEDPASCGIRELAEETGCTAGSFLPFGKVYPTPGYVDEVLYLFVAKELSLGEQHLDADEFLTMERIPFDQAVELCLNGEIKDAKTLVALLKYAVIKHSQFTNNL